MSLSDAPAAAVREMPLLPAAGGAEHRDELRDRFLRAGPDSVDDRELLELLLSGSHSAAEAGALALILLDTFGAAPRVLAARPDALRAVPGLGETGVCAVKTAEALGIRFASRGPGCPTASIPSSIPTKGSSATAARWRHIATWRSCTCERTLIN